MLNDINFHDSVLGKAEDFMASMGSTGMSLAGYLWYVLQILSSFFV